MKQRKLLIFCILSVLISGTIIGCGAEETNVAKQEEVLKESQEGNQEENQQQIEVKSSEEEESENVQERQDREKQFTINRKVYEDGDVYIEYPYVENLVNEEITDWYNKKFRSVIDICNGDVEEGDLAAGNAVEETFEVTYQSEDMVSILITGNFYAESAAHPCSYMSSYNINLKTGETIGITDKYTPEEIVDDILSGQNCTVLSNVETLEEADEEMVECVKQEISEESREWLLAGMQECDYNFKVGADGKIAEGEDITSKYSIRLKDGTWAIGMDVSHALGDYIIIRYDK